MNKSTLSKIIGSIFIILISYLLYNYLKEDVMNNETKIGENIFSNENLDTKEFRNGDPIKLANTKEEWTYASKMKIPAYCITEDYDILYNFYAIEDKREIAPEGWRIISMEEWYKIKSNISNNDELKRLLIAPSKSKKTRSGFAPQYAFSARLDDGEYVPCEWFLWWVNNYEKKNKVKIAGEDFYYENPPSIVGVSNGFEGVRIDINEYKKGGGFLVRCVKEEKGFFDPLIRIIKSI